MKLSELREQTKDLPDDTELCFNVSAGCCGDSETLEVEDSCHSSYKTENYFTLYFKTLPYISSCRKWAAARRIGEVK